MEEAGMLLEHFGGIIGDMVMVNVCLVLCVVFIGVVVWKRNNR
tara:strand:+ start:7612 stop:7740 length:129 start_codon:yes stop_codon:yes gene_type:complete